MILIYYLQITLFLKKINKHINHDLKLLTARLRANQISLSTSKTEILLFRRKSKRNITKHRNFIISGQYIPRKTEGSEQTECL